jgi:hypothetical protein
MSYTTQYSNGEIVSQTLRMPKYNKLGVYNIIDTYMARFHKEVKESMRDTGILVDSDFPIEEVFPTYNVKCDAVEYTSQYKYNEFNVIVQPPTDSYLEIRLFLSSSLLAETMEELRDESKMLFEKSVIQEIAFVGILRRLHEHCEYMCNVEAK